jgi:GH25 family lysozyme M1 (1,4-beta-N-acetylmuramidase)
MPPPIAIDVSRYQSVDWQKVANAGVKVGIAKVNQTFFGVDNQFAHNWENIRKAGLLRGTYSFMSAPMVRAPTVAQARQNNVAHGRPEFPVTLESYLDANWTVTWVPTPALMRANADDAINRIVQGGGLQPGDLPPALDCEDEVVTVQLQDSEGAPLRGATVNRWRFMPGGAAAIQGLMSAWLEQVEQNLPRLNGRRPIIYTGNPFWTFTAGDPMNTGNTGEGVPYREYPLWVPSYTQLNGPNSRVIVPRPWRQNNWFLWQYSGSGRVDGVFSPGTQVLSDCDLNTLVTMRPDPGQPNTILREESNDITPLERIAGIEQRTTAIRLSRQYPTALTASPTNAFNVLLVTQGFWTDEIPEIARQLWEGARGAGVAVEGLTDIPPFNMFRTPNQPGLVVHFDPGPGVFLRLCQKPNTTLVADELALPPDSADRIGALIANLQVRVDADSGPFDVPANTLWPTFSLVGGTSGSLVVVVRKPQLRTPLGSGPPAKPAELYQIDPSATCPVPMVAVNAIGEHWPRVVARAIAQILGGLGDEYELDGAAFAAPPAELFQPSAPNLKFLTAEDRTKLGPPENKPVLDVVPSLRTQWSLPAGDLPFLAHKGTDPNPNWSTDPAFTAPATAPGRIKAMEGGGGFRSGVLRSDYDCLMRRIPTGVATTMTPAANLPVQARVDLCTACLDALRRAGQLFLRPRIRLSSQRVLFDQIKWQQVTTQAIPFSQVLGPNAATAARWSCAVSVDANTITITDVKLQNRDDPFTAVSRIFENIVFDPPRITFGNDAPIVLQIRDALANTVNPPKLETAIGGAALLYQLGIKLSLSWNIRNAQGRDRCVVDAVLSVVFKSQVADIDPQGTVLGSRVYPQLALRYRQLRSGERVSALFGTVRVAAVNAIPTTQAGLAPEIQPLANGRLVASTFCESNRAGLDSTFTTGVPMRASSGRKVAALRGVGTGRVPTQFFPPLWSWRFDYARPALPAGSPAFVGVRGAHDAAHAIPPASLTWPPGSAFRVTAEKQARQGDYDCIVIHPDRGSDGSGSPIIAAPSCGDLGVHLHMRRGLSTVHAPRSRGPFIGWGAGRGDQGAGSVKGAPLVPPNQHIDVTVNRVHDGRIDLVYAAECRTPGPAEWQVILEQGLSCGFKYVLNQGLGIDDLVFLARATAAANDATIAAIRQAAADTAHPAVLDARLRAFYQALFPKLRFYDVGVDTDVNGNVQQVPDVNGPPAAMERS